ncbi:MAG: hypothetical protein PHE24_01955 [Patescibacteria group bacterium]|nr:hypothetical protein [Patescibacteria group bacterium]
MRHAKIRINLQEEFGEMLKKVEAGEKLEGISLTQFNKFQLMFAGTNRSDFLTLIEAGQKLIKK